MEDIKIMNLADVPEYTEEVSCWLWQEWGKAAGYTRDELLYRTKHCMQKESVPQTFIAFYKTRPAGVVSLWMNDLKTRQDLYPWLATLYVKPEYRCLKIGQALQKHCISRAALTTEYPYLYLITEHDGYYEKTGWEFIEKVPTGTGEIEKIYRCDLRKARYVKPDVSDAKPLK